MPVIIVLHTTENGMFIKNKIKIGGVSNEIG